MPSARGARGCWPPPARSSSGPASTPGARPGQVHRRRAVEPRQGLVGAGQPPDRGGRLRSPPGPPGRPPRRQGALRPGLLHRRRAGAPAQPAGLHRDGLGQHLRPEPVPSPDRRRPRRFVPNFTIIDVPSFKADPATEGTRTGDRDPGPPQADGDHHRRHRVRRRDQEVGVHGDELPDAGRGRPADALGGQRREAAGDPSSSSACRAPARRPSRPTRCAA